MFWLNGDGPLDCFDQYEKLHVVMSSFIRWNLLKTYRKFDTKPLSERIMSYCQLDPWDQNPVKFKHEYTNAHIFSQEMHWRCRQHNARYIFGF